MGCLLSAQEKHSAGFKASMIIPQNTSALLTLLLLLMDVFGLVA
jgi:hypothetical protein